MVNRIRNTRGRTTAAAVLALLVAAAPAGAKGWEAPEWHGTFVLQGTSNLFPGSNDTGADRGLEAEIEVSTARRLSKPLKLGLAARAGADAWQSFEKARWGRGGATATLRHGHTQFVLDGEWTPRRFKFGDDNGDAVFARRELRVGVRQAVGPAVRARAEWRGRDDDFVSAFDARDERGAGGYAQLAWQPAPRLSLRAEGETDRSTAVNPKHSNVERWVGGGATWRPSAWRVESWLRSGTRRYEDAVAGDSNFGRRDQYVSFGARLSRSIGSEWSLFAGGELLDQSSSRLDRAYTVRTVQLGAEWIRVHP